MVIRQVASSFSAAKCRARVESFPPENNTANRMVTLMKKSGLYACLNGLCLNFYAANIWDGFNSVGDISVDFFVEYVNCNGVPTVSDLP